ncbi:hypothetical protein TVAG_467770 [Trichomonas vaginalis G3]|uniref:Uncharacterized protein n=1 Tax=Trichomonas vaginalis (strain ATCC PRA-98 / G3) TaxID=412133 RepID=A2E0L7_TRIV3|nr:protein kinase protein [Trichomonas vaginalis G3]EAY13762.1 hypothetical protein TVAG_467770 [Trichomonas vaginalis G3]KAI5542722.1 protein kinase protein [Trichomonas vaginalis G3]|eukprot:XP_001325985.1 hypothetical protein [Trichomonas vaginalis G3]
MTETTETLNIKVFKKLTNKNFSEGLERAPSLLRSRQASLFYKTLLAHFTNPELTTEIGDSILKTLSQCLKNEDNLRCFIDGSFANMLPNDQERFFNSVFEVFYVIVTTGSILIDETIANVLHPLIKFNPKKSLTIIALYCQNFGEIDNPWPMIDLLIQEGSHFNIPNVAQDYISLLAFLNKKYIEYRKGRSQHCWNQIISMLSTDDTKILAACYGGLCTISEFYPGGAIQIDSVSQHLKNTELQNSVLAMLNVATLNENDASSKKLISTLMSIAETNVKATLILMKLGCIFSAAQTIFSMTGWINKKLPTTTDTLRLFLVLLRHKDLREEIAESPDFVEFLKQIITMDRPGVVPIACTIIRRVPLSKDLATNLSKSGFLKQFYDAPEDGDDGLTKHSKLLLTDTICRVCYVREYLSMCDKIAEIIIENGEFTDSAALVAVRLCKYRKCKDRFKELKLDAFFKKDSLKPKLQNVGKKFLKAISDEESK